MHALEPSSRFHPDSTSSHAVCFPSASSRCWAATHPRVTSSGFCSLHSVSHALKVLLRPTPAGFVSCRSRPWDFPSGPISTRRAVRPFERRYPLAVRPRTSASGSCSLRVSLSPNEQCSNGDSDPHGIRLPRGFSLLAVARRPSSPELHGQQASWLTIALQSFVDEKVGWTLSSLPPLSRFSHLVDNSGLCRARDSGLLLRGPRCCHPGLTLLRADRPAAGAS